jgi:hypothetical protein
MGFDVRVKTPTVTNVAVEIEFSGDADGADVALACDVTYSGYDGRYYRDEIL